MLPILTDSLCDRCIALCCKYITIEIDKPRTKREKDDVRWYLLHEGVTLLVDKDRWMVKCPTRCSALSDDDKCTIYDNRPQTCREYDTKNCDFYTAYEGWETEYIEIETVEAFEKYLNSKKKKRASSKTKKSKKANAN